MYPYAGKASSGIAGSVEKAMALYYDHWNPDFGCCDTPGDVNNDGSIDIADLTYYVAYMFNNGPPPVCMAEGDINGDGQLDISDLTFRICFFFFNCPAPVCGPE